MALETVSSTATEPAPCWARGAIRIRREAPAQAAAIRREQGEFNRTRSAPAIPIPRAQITQLVPHCPTAGAYLCRHKAAADDPAGCSRAAAPNPAASSRAECSRKEARQVCPRWGMDHASAANCHGGVTARQAEIQTSTPTIARITRLRACSTRAVVRAAPAAAIIPAAADRVVPAAAPNKAGAIKTTKTKTPSTIRRAPK